MNSPASALAGELIQTIRTDYSNQPYGRLGATKRGRMKTRFEMNLEAETLEALRIRANGFPVAEIIRHLIDAYLREDELSVPDIRGTKARRAYHRSVASQAIAKLVSVAQACER